MSTTEPGDIIRTLERARARIAHTEHWAPLPEPSVSDLTYDEAVSFLYARIAEHLAHALPRRHPPLPARMRLYCAWTLRCAADRLLTYADQIAPW